MKPLLLGLIVLTAIVRAPRPVHAQGIERRSSCQ